MIFKVLEIQGKYQPDTSQIVPVINRNAFLIDCFKQKSLCVETVLYKMKSLNKGAFYCCYDIKMHCSSLSHCERLAWKQGYLNIFIGQCYMDHKECSGEYTLGDTTTDSI